MMSGNWKGHTSQNPSHSLQKDPNSSNQNQQMTGIAQFSQIQGNVDQRNPNAQQSRLQGYPTQKRPLERDKLKWSEQPTVD